MHRAPTDAPSAWLRPSAWIRWLGSCLLVFQCACPIDYYDPSAERRRRELLDAGRLDATEDLAEADTDTDSETPCGAFCERFATICAPASRSGCLEACSALPDAEQWPGGGVFSGDTLACRTTYLDRAVADETACVDADPSRHTSCFEPCQRFCQLVDGCPDPSVLYDTDETCLEACASRDVTCQLAVLGDSLADEETRCRRGALDSCYCLSRGLQDDCLGSTGCDTALDTVDHCGGCDQECLVAGSPGSCQRRDAYWGLQTECVAMCDGLRCGEVCVLPDSDPTDCGASACGEGVACVSDQVCDGRGQCADACAPDLELCGERCTNVSSDPDNCGDCDRACRANEACVEGHCRCAGTWSDCDGQPETGCEVDLARDAEHCGSCDAACSVDCRAGQCLARLTALAVGLAHSCVVDRGQVVCWGSNARAQLGRDVQGLIGSPGPVTDLSGVVDIALGANHGCALTDNGEVLCWGANDLGQVGQPAGDDVPLPTPVEGLSGVERIAAGDSQSCAIDGDGVTWCWGLRVRSGGVIWGHSSEPRALGFSPLDDLDLGTDFTCGVSLAKVSCLGSNTGGRLGVGSAVSELVRPARVLGLSASAQLALGDGFACALARDGQVACWGDSPGGEAGQLGVVSTPNPIALDAPAAAIGAGGGQSCAILADGTLRCWGAGVSDVGETVRVALEDVVEVAPSGDHACALLADESVRCWGENGDGQLGDGTTLDSLTPVQVSWE